MSITNTEGTVITLDTESTGYGRSARVVGTMVTVETIVTDTDDDGDIQTAEVESKIFLAPGEILPAMGAKVSIIMGEEGAIDITDSVRSVKFPHALPGPEIVDGDDTDQDG